MTSIVLNDESSRIPIGEILATATDSVVELKDQHGVIVAEIILHRRAKMNGASAAIAWAESEVEELRRRESADRSKDVTTAQLIRIAEQRLAEQKP